MARKKRDLGTAVDAEDVPSTDGEQSGDLQGLPDDADADSQSVRELVAEGQAFEAEVISGIENAPLADEGEIRTREVPEDDVPGEYREQQRDSPKE